MNYIWTKFPCIVGLIFIFNAGIIPIQVSAAGVTHVIKVGVLAKRGVDPAIAQWKPTIDFLSKKIPNSHFELVPLKFDDILPKVAANEIDFLITNPSMYVEMEMRYGVSRIATLKNLGPDGRALTTFGGVIFTKANRHDIQSIKDLKNITSFMAVKESSLGGFQLAWSELKKAGINPYKDFKLIFRGTHDAVVFAIANGEADVGTVRTDTLERMNAEGKININNFKIINSQRSKRNHLFPYALSTETMPEWAIAKLVHTPDRIARQVVVALLEMKKNDPAAIAGRFAGWTVALNYQPVQQLMKELHIGPFRNFGKLSLHKFMADYWQWIVTFLIIFTSLMFLLSYIVKINRKLKVSEKVLLTEAKELHNVETKLAERGNALQAEIEQNAKTLEYLGKIRKYHDITSLLITTLNPKALLQKALDRVVELSESEIGAIYLLDKDDQLVRPFVFHGVSISSINAVGLHESLPAQVIADGKPRHLQKMPKECTLAIDFGFGKSCPNELILLPMRSKGKSLGMIILGSLGCYKEEDIEVLSHISDQISIMLENALINENMEHLSICDGLTGLYNRRYLNDLLELDVKKARRYGENIGLLMIDIDHFKSINDTFGHPIGDLVLIEVAHNIQKNIRDIDTVARFGGEEFMVVLSASDQKCALIVAEKIRQCIMGIDFEHQGIKGVTVSIGIAAYLENKITNAEMFVQLVDQALYKAKANGRNQCCVIGDF